MTRCSPYLLAALFALGEWHGTPCQAAVTAVQSPAQPAQVVPVRAPHFLDPANLPLASLIPSPPSADSVEGKADLAEVHRIERTRTPAQVRAAQYDDTQEDIFIYSGVVGQGFNAQTLPLTFALSKHLRSDAGLIDNPLKLLYKRPRTYNFDHSLHPVCETNQEMSYPSGHAINGYLYAFTLAELLPARHDAILNRADAYAHNRVVCGSHYPTDTEASRRVASFVFGALLVNPLFIAELEAARAELHQHLLHP